MARTSRCLAGLMGLSVLAAGCVRGAPPGAADGLLAHPASYGSGFSAAERQQAERYLAEAATLCARDGGRLWGISLCGPIAIVDPTTHAVATNEPPPAAQPPAAFGYANAALDWGGRRWTTVMWQQLAAAEQAGYGARSLMMHELFHRIQPQLGLLLPDSHNDHLDTVEGRYWMLLEWRALDKALQNSGSSRTGAVRDALAFRAARRAAFPQAADNERVAEVNEGLAEYTGIVTATPSRDAWAGAAVQRLKMVLAQRSFVRSFAYGSGPAYGVLLESLRPGWTRQFTATDDLSSMLMAAAGLQPSADIEAAAARFGGAELRVREEARETERRARVADIRRRFIDGPVLVFPPAHSYAFAGDVTPIGDAGSVYPGFRAHVEWGTLEAAEVLIAADGSTVTVPAPTRSEGSRLTGDGWTFTLAPGWAVRPGPRSGDLQVARVDTPPPPR